MRRYQIVSRAPGGGDVQVAIGLNGEPITLTSQQVVDAMVQTLNESWHGRRLFLKREVNSAPQSTAIAATTVR